MRRPGEDKQRRRSMLTRLLEAMDGCVAHRSFWLVWSICFIVLLVLSSAFFFVFRKGFIWSVDGFQQQYPFFVYEGTWLRELLSNIFVKHSFVVPMWSDLLGYGQDSINFLADMLGNPFNLVSVFCTAETAEYGLVLTSLAQVWLAGALLARLLQRHGAGGFDSIVSGLVYTLGGFSVVMFHQLLMLYSLLLGVLVLDGIDRVFERTSPIRFVVSMTLTFLFSVSVGWAICLLLVVYCCVRYAFLDERKSIRGFLGWFARIFAMIVLSLVAAAVLFLPPVLAIFGQGRLTEARSYDALYSLSYYAGLLTGFDSAADVGADCLTGFAPVGVISVFFVFADRKKGSRQALAVMFVILTAFLCIPLVGRIFNGFSYPNNRWVWAYSLLVSCMTCYALPRLRGADETTKLRLLKILCVYALLGLITIPLNMTVNSFVPSLVLVLLLVVLLFWASTRELWWRKAVLVTLGMWCLVAFGFRAMPMMSSAGLTQKGAAFDNVDIGSCYSKAVTYNPMSLLDGLDEGTSERADGGDYDAHRNGGLVTGQHLVSYYNSLYSQGIDDYHTSVGLATDLNFSYAFAGGRGALEAIAGVRYYVARSDSKSVPAIFDQQVRSGTIGKDSWTVWGTDHVLPLAFVANDVISRTSYDALTAPEREQALLQGVVVDDTHGASTTAVDTSSLVVAGEGAQPLTSTKVDGSVVTVLSSNGSISVPAEVPAGVHAYLYLDGFTLSPSASLSLPGTSGSGGGILRKVAKTLYSAIYSKSSESSIRVSCGSVTSGFILRTQASSLYSGRQTWVADLGTADVDRTSATVSFSATGTYQLSVARVVLVDESKDADRIDSLGSQPAQDISLSDNGMSCSVTVDGSDDGLVFVRIPYDAGWSAAVDGEDAQIVKADVGFIGVWVSPGTHELRLTYETPGLRVGAALSVAGILGIVALYVVRRRRRA